jgi:uncharacterized RDD family membrane protein YckC
MDLDGVVERREFQDFPKTDMYMPKRIGSYLFDLIVVAFVVTVIFYLAGTNLEDPWIWLIITGITGVSTIIVKAVLEAGTGKTLGKALFGLKTISMEGDLDFGQAFARNIFSVIPLVGPLVDLVFGKGSAEDDRQKLMDVQSDSLVVEDVILPVEEPKVRVYREPVKIEPKPKEKVRLDFRSMRVGHCPRCGAPYRVLPPDDPSFSGLWNHRCTWCNHLISEDERA